MFVPFQWLEIVIRKELGGMNTSRRDLGFCSKQKSYFADLSKFFKSMKKSG